MAREYKCNTAKETLEWINAIIDFIKPYKFFLQANVVNFFKDRQWEAVDEDWMDCLRNENVENLLLIPSGVVQEHWPESLNKFLLTSRHLSLTRDQAELQKVFGGGKMTELDKVLAQGMNAKKKHEIEALAGVISLVAQRVEADTIVDVGAGQGYLSQVLSFQHQHSVYAIDASSHHGRVTDARAERIRKHYAANIRKSRSKERDLRIPQTVTCRVLSANMLKNLSDSILKKDHNSLNHPRESIVDEPQTASCSSSGSSCNSTLVLAGLHACGDLSVTMLRTFLECEEVKAVVSIGCCYNLISEEDRGAVDHHCGFPLSRDLKCSDFRLGKNARDLACQSAERWRSLGKTAGANNFELHAFRAAFQMVLFQYYPETLMSSLAIGRQGKSLRRQQQWKVLESGLNAEELADSSTCYNKGSRLHIDCSRSGNDLNSAQSFFGMSCNSSTRSSCIGNEEKDSALSLSSLLNVVPLTRIIFIPSLHFFNSATIVSLLPFDQDKGSVVHNISVAKDENSSQGNRFAPFIEYCQSRLCRLGRSQLHDVELQTIWEKTHPFMELIGPFWSLRAALGPVLETLLLLDRLLYLQEQGSALEVMLIPIFDPVLSPRNVALIAQKISG